MNKVWVMASDGSGYLAQQDKDKPGSCAAVIYPYDGRNEVNESIGVRVGHSRLNTTNGQMEVAGAGFGLAAFNLALRAWGIDTQGIELNVVVDAQYVYCAYNPHPTKSEQGFWMQSWKERGWKTSSNKPVENLNLWFFVNREIEKLQKMGVTIKWHWVAGHDSCGDVKNRLNNRVDSMCTRLVQSLRTNKGMFDDYKGEEAWYEIFCSGETPELVGIPRLTTPRLSLFHQYNNMFDTSFVKVITVNTVGAMGKGLALEFANRYPEGERAYKQMVSSGQFKGRRVIPWVAGDGSVFLFAATKEHWRNPSRMEWVVQCAREIAAWYFSCDPVVKGICVPPLGCGNGGLDWTIVKPLILKELDDVKVLIIGG